LHTNAKANERFDYEITVVLDDIFVGPEQVSEKQTRHQKEIFVEKEQFGQNNQVMVDTTGKPIMVKVSEDIFCDVVEVRQVKEGWLSGRIEILNGHTGELIFEDRMRGSANFFNHFAVANGDVNALDKATRRLLNNAHLPFPSDRNILETSVDQIKPMLLDLVQENRHLIL